MTALLECRMSNDLQKVTSDFKVLISTKLKLDSLAVSLKITFHVHSYSYLREVEYLHLDCIIRNDRNLWV